MNFKDFYIKENLLKKIANIDVGQHTLGALKGMNPFSKKGLIGKSANWLKDKEDYFRTGGKEKEKDDVAKWREYKIYPQDSNTAFNTQVENILNIKLPIQPKDQKPFFAQWVVKRNSPIKYASHIANLVMDKYVSNIQKQIPKDRALQFALDDTILNDELKRWISRSGMINAV